MSKFEEISQENLPYTVVGHTSTPKPMLSILLTAEGIIELAKRVEKGDMVRITEWSDYTSKCENQRCYGDITILKDIKV